MKFYKTNTSLDIVDYLVDKIRNKLAQDQTVLWFLSGGSAIALEVEAARQLAGLAGLSQLSIALMDERFGPVGHTDSNWQQLKLAGFSLPNANLMPTLNGGSLSETVGFNQTQISQALASADYAIGVAGIGADGHILGIKPGSPALNSTEIVCGYAWSDYQRITLTANAIEQMDEVVVYAMGREKKQQLINLKQDLPASQQPAQLLKLCPQLIIFNDQID